MANDILVIPHLSPRIIKILAPVTAISVQELSNQIKDWEDEPANLSYPVLISTSGKENLGGGVFVGITAELQNAVVMFEARTESDAHGNVTDGTNSSTTLIDDNANFSNINAGDSIVNWDTGSVATILSVDSTTQITHEPLDDGTVNTWAYADEYKIWNKIQCEITGGNLVAVDINGADMSAFLPSAFTHVVRTSASSATIQALEIIDLVHRIESLRESHPRFGRIIYWDPIGGNDANLAESPTQAVATFARAHDLATAETGDVIFALSRSATGQSIVVTEQITFTKDTLSLRGPGKNFIISTTAAGPSVSIQASNVGVSNLAVTSSGALATNAIEINGSSGAINNILLKSIEVQGDNSKQSGITLNDVSEIEITDVVIEDVLRDGIRASSTVSRLNISNTEIEGCGKSGINLLGPTVSDVIVENCLIGNNSNFGISIGSSTNVTVVRANNTFFNNSNGNISETIGSQKVSIEQEQIDKPIRDIEFSIESQREHHSTFGTTFYWDPVNGNDINTGLIPEKSLKTFRKTLELLPDNSNSMIVALPGSTTGVTVTSEIITIAKNFVFLRGPGRNFIIQPLIDSGQLPYTYATGTFVIGQTLTQNVSGATATIVNIWNDANGDDLHLENIVGTFDTTNLITSPTATALPEGSLVQGGNQITITGNGVEISGLAFETTTPLTTHSIRTTGDFTLIKNCWFDIAPGEMGVRIDNSAFSIIEDNHFEESTLYAIHVRDNVSNLTIKGNFIDDSVIHGIHLDDTSNYQKDVEITNNRIFNCQQFGINIGPGANNTFIRKDNFLGNNTLGDINDNGTNTVLEIEQDQLSQFQGSVRIDVGAGVTGTEFPNGTPGHPVNNPEDAKIIADRVGLKKYIIEGSITLTADHGDWTFEGEHGNLNDTIDLYGNNINESNFINLKLQGTQAGKGITVNGCILDNVSEFSGHAVDSMILGTISIQSSPSPTIFLNVSSADTNPITMDTQGSGRIIAGVNLSGNWIIANMDSKGFPITTVSLEFASGEVTLNTSNIGGTIELGGLANLTNSSISTSVDSTNLFQPSAALTGGEAWDEIITDHETANTFGKKLIDILKLKRTQP